MVSNFFHTDTAEFTRLVDVIEERLEFILGNTVPPSISYRKRAELIAKAVWDELHLMYE